MRHPNNRMAMTQTRTPLPTRPIERVLVQPPPESVIKCPRCGAARIGQWQPNGTHGATGQARRICRMCGAKAVIDRDWKNIRIVG